MPLRRSKMLWALAGLAVGLTGGWWAANVWGHLTDLRVIAASWGDGKYGEQLYGARGYVTGWDGN